MNPPNAKRLRRLAPACWVGIAVAMASLLGGGWRSPSDPPLREISWPSDAQWIRTGDELQAT